MYLTLRQLQYFEKIVLAGNITRAAAQLGVSPTAISLQIRLLEERSGHTLLERHSRGVRVTAIGREFYEKSKRILNLVAETEATLAAHQEPRPKFLIGMPPRTMRSLGYDCLRARRTGGISCDVGLRELHATDLLPRLTGREVDLAIGFELKRAPDVHVVEILKERLSLITPRSFLPQGRPVSLAEALATHLIIYSQYGLFWDVIRRAANAQGLNLPEPEIIGSMDVIVHLIADGHGTTIAPRAVVEDELARGELREIEIDGPPLQRSLCLAINEADRTNPALAGLIEDVCALARRRQVQRGSIYTQR